MSTKRPYPRSVEEAANFLDRVKPGWAKLIDLNRLYMRQNYTCILGQLYGSHMIATRDLFDVQWELFKMDTVFGCNASVEAWKEQINLRLGMKFEQALAALREGKTVKRKSSSDRFILKDNVLISPYDGHRRYINDSIMAEDWEIVAKPLTMSDIKPGERFAYGGATFVMLDKSLAPNLVVSTYVYFETDTHRAFGTSTNHEVTRS